MPENPTHGPLGIATGGAGSATEHGSIMLFGSVLALAGVLRRKLF